MTPHHDCLNDVDAHLPSAPDGYPGEHATCEVCDAKFVLRVDGSLLYWDHDWPAKVLAARDLGHRLVFRAGAFHHFWDCIHCPGVVVVADVNARCVYGRATVSTCDELNAEKVAA